MTLVYARLADRTVAEEYFNVTEKVEALYDTHQPAKLPVDDEGTQMRKLRAEMHRRMLGNGYCARPAELDHHVPGKGDPMSVWASAPPDLHQQDADIRDLDPGDFPHITGWLSALPKIGSDP